MLTGAFWRLFRPSGQPIPSGLALASIMAAAFSCPDSQRQSCGRPPAQPLAQRGKTWMAKGGLSVNFPPPFVLEADTGENPKGLSAPSQFHHKYPDRASGAELIVQGPAAALPETMLPAVGGCRPRQETPPGVPQGPWPRHRSAASDQAWRHFEAGLDSGTLARDL